VLNQEPRAWLRDASIVSMLAAEKGDGSVSFADSARIIWLWISSWPATALGFSALGHPARVAFPVGVAGSAERLVSVFRFFEELDFRHNIRSPRAQVRRWS
jgi:hypothetical protein